MSLSIDEISISIELKNIKENLKKPDCKVLKLQTNFPQWNTKQLLELKEAIQASSIEEIDFTDCNIGSCSIEQVDVLFQDLLNDKIHTLNLAENILGHMGFKKLLSFFNEKSSIQSLNLSNNYIKAICLTEAFDNNLNNTLRYLNLAHNHLTNDLISFAPHWLNKQPFSILGSSNLNKLKITLDLTKLDMKFFESFFNELNKSKIVEIEFCREKTVLRDWQNRVINNLVTEYNYDLRRGVFELTHQPWNLENIIAFCNAIRNSNLTSITFDDSNFTFNSWSDEEFQALIDAIQANPNIIEMISDNDMREDRKILIQLVVNDNLMKASNKVNLFAETMKDYQIPTVLEDLMTQYWLNDKAINLTLAYKADIKASSSSSSSEHAIEENSSLPSSSSSNASVSNQIAMNNKRELGEKEEPDNYKKRGLSYDGR